MQISSNSPGILSAGESFLQAEHYTYQKRADGTLQVSGSIDLARRGLKALPDLSDVVVTGDFHCQDNHLTSLKGAPREVHGGFWCNGNKLETLEHTPERITGQFVCHDNNLTTLAHAPAKIKGDFCCAGNPLASLEDAPRLFNSLRSDFGIFDSWEKIPEGLRLSPEANAARLTAAAQEATVLKGALRISKPLALKKPRPVSG